MDNDKQGDLLNISFCPKTVINLYCTRDHDQSGHMILGDVGEDTV